MSWPRSVANHTTPAAARKGRASSTRRRKTRVDSRASCGSLPQHEIDRRGERRAATRNGAVGDVGQARKLGEQQREGKRHDQHDARRRPVGDRTKLAMSKLLITGSPEASTRRRPIHAVVGVKIARPSSWMRTWKPSASRQRERKSAHVRAARPLCIDFSVGVTEYSVSAATSPDPDCMVDESSSLPRATAQPMPG